MNKFETVFKTKTSVCLGFFFIIIHAGAFYSICFVPIFWLYKFVLLFGLFLSLIIVMRRHVLHNRFDSIIKFGPAVGLDNCWYLMDYSGNTYKAVIDYPVFISNNLIVMNFILMDVKKKISLIIVKDCLTSDSFRKLKFIVRTNR